MSQNLPEQSPCGTMPEMQQRIAGLGVSAVECHVQQTPTAANGNVAVAQTTLEGNGVRVSMPGIATPETANTDKPHLLMRAALMASADNATHAFERRQGSTQPRRQESQSAGERHASPTKAISPKQCQFIVKLCSEIGLNPDEVARKQAGKSLRQCSAADANTMIRHLKDKKDNDNSVPW